MQLVQLIEHVACVSKPQTDVEISDICCDSRKVIPGSLFFCVPGTKEDGHIYAEDAAKKGAAALVVTRLLEAIDLPQVVVADIRLAMAEMAAAFYGHPARGMRLVALTGTAGKTTTSYMLKAIADAAGLRTGLIGSIENVVGEERIPSSLTTPDAIDLQRLLYRMKEAGAQLVVMEATAHALALERIAGLTFELGVFTNLAQDHYDFFGDEETYFTAKRKLFDGKMCKTAVINVDDEHGARLLNGESAAPCVSFGIRENAMYCARNIEIDAQGIDCQLRLNKQSVVQAHLGVSGLFNVYNALAAAACAHLLGIEDEAIAAGLQSAWVPGRIQRLDVGDRPFQVILDYAHKPDSLEKVLSAVRGFTKHRLILVFGCGGDRDREKRPIMGRIAGVSADHVIVTSDNPRTENPQMILDEIEQGLRETACPYQVVENRREAIRAALMLADEGDVVLLAGKGHETYQEIMGVKHAFDEVVVVRELLQEIAKQS